jgi:phenylalanyl-tRNA synthetase beta subunit
MFNKYYICDDHNAVIAANIAARSNKELGETLKSISKEEIKSKDRVDITVDEYLKLLNQIQILEQQTNHMSNLLNRLGFPVEEINHIVPDSINVLHNVDPFDFTTKYQINFTVDSIHEVLRTPRQYHRYGQQF